MFDDMPLTLEDIAYRDARYSFENERDRVNDEALAAHDAGDEDLAQELLAQARSMVFTGLRWN